MKSNSSDPPDRPDARAFSPYAGLVEPSKRPRLPKLDADSTRRLNPVSAMVPKPTAAATKRPPIPATWLGRQRKKQ